MQKIPFTSGTIIRMDSEYLTLRLFNGEKQVYAATIDDTEACKLIMKHDNIKRV